VTGITFSDPIAFTGQAMNGEKAWFGWPTNDQLEKLRDRWALAPTLDERKSIAREMQKIGWDQVPHVILGQFYRSSAWRRNIKGVIAMPEVVGFWNIEKTA
jgi:peptide/nickel transport system substrate-binding protein